MAFTEARYIVANEEQLIKLYKDTYLKILAQIDSSKDFTLARRAILLARINNDLRNLQVDTDRWLERELPKQYYAGARLAQDQLRELRKATNVDLLKMTSITTQYNKRAVAAMVSDASTSFAQSIQGVARAVKNLTGIATQQEIKASIAQGVVSGSTRKEIVATVKAQIRETGLDAIKDKGGRTWTLDRYSDMLVRTKMVEARNTGMANQMLANGNDLVQVSRNGSKHKECAQYEGKVLTITGDTPGYTTLDDAKAGGLFHPNCKHTINAINISLAEKTYGYNTTTGEYEQGLLTRD